MTIEEKATNDDTRAHIHRVAELIHKVVIELLERADRHDRSKLEDPERAALAAAGPLDNLVYGSAAYEENKLRLKAALDHHYARNRHHPQHFKNGVNDMTLIDFLEMICDWKASSERHNTGNLLKSIEHNCGPNVFNICPQLQRILENTAEAFELS